MAADLAELGVRGGPLWWLARLDGKIRARVNRTKKFDDYYDGAHRLQFMTERFRAAFGDLFGSFSDNWCPIVVDVPVDRLEVQGFRLGTDQVGDAAVWKLWQANGLDARAKMLFTEAGISEESYSLVWPGEENGTAEITVEHPWQVIVELGAANPRHRIAALKRWTDDVSGKIYATVYLPDFVWKFESANAVSSSSTSILPRGANWQQRIVAGEDWPLRNPLEVVPVVPFANRPRMLKPGRSDLRDVLPIQDAVNKIVADMMIASEYGAVPARWATAWKERANPETNQSEEDAVMREVQQSLGRLFTNPNSEARFGSFMPADLQNFVHAMEALIQHMATQAQIPPHHFFLRGEFPSGESIVSAEAGLVRKVNGKATFFGEALEETMRLALLAAGDEKRAKAEGMETIWVDPETRSESEHVDAITKLAGINVPDEILWEKAGLTPAEIERAKKLNAENPPEPDTDPNAPPQEEEPPAAA